MARADLRDILNLVGQDGQVDERKLKKQLLPAMDARVQAENDTLKKIKVGKEVSTPVVRWKEMSEYVHRVTAQMTGSSTQLTFTGGIYDQAVTTASLKDTIRVGTILQRPTDLMMVEVTDITGLASSPYTCVVQAWGGKTGSDDGAGVSWDIINELWGDYDEVGDPRALDFRFREVGTEIHEETFEIPWTRENTGYEHTNNEVQFQIAKLTAKMRRKLAYSVLRSAPRDSGGTPQWAIHNAKTTMRGLIEWPAYCNSEYSKAGSYFTMSDTELPKRKLDDLARELELGENANFNMGDWWIICHPKVHEQINDYDAAYRQSEYSTEKSGYVVNKLLLSNGYEYPVMRDRYFPEGVLLMIDLSKCSYGYYKNDRMRTKEIATKGRFKQWMVTFQTYGTVVRDPRASIGMIYGIKTS